mgnify:CR=1 FL=1
MDEQQLEILLERAAKKGAAEALKTIGLSDDDAVHDVHELRTMLDAWRSLKKSVGRTLAQALTMGVLGMLATVLYFTGRG